MAGLVLLLVHVALVNFHKLNAGLVTAMYSHIMDENCAQGCGAHTVNHANSTLALLELRK